MSAQSKHSAADQQQRQHALDVSCSFIVQAPAGSGKTELLIQRYLALLAGVEAPEEVIAITFTRKAAAEMRSRVLAALAAGANDTQPAAGHEQTTWRLARAARARDAALGWELAANPNRLRIDTIDALCHALARQMPVLSRFGARPETVTDAQPLYEEAARRTLALLEAGGADGALVATLLAHIDNNVGTAISLMAGMLAKRDQWIRHVAVRMPPEERRAQLEAALANEVEQTLVRLAALLPGALGTELAALLRYACAHLTAVAPSPIAACTDQEALPGAQAHDLDAWRGVAELVLTKEGTLRKQVNKNTGFPPGVSKAEKAAASEAKARHAALMTELVPHRTFVEALHFTRALPPAAYSDAQWQIVEALVTLLPLAAANLTLIFGERGQADFTAVSQAALLALGEDDAPTDLALALDYRIRHLLVDEFQDTSLSQFELLTRLTAGWQRDDGRTLFVVGDPMQSIYRFREADVGLYLRARIDGIGSVPLTPLTLTVNFRSQRGVVDWVNRTFAQVMPDAEDLASGAVPYVRSQAQQTDEAADQENVEVVHVHALGGFDRALEAQRVVDIVQWEQSENPNKNIVLLVRARGHLRFIAHALREAGLSFQAVEIEALGQRPVVQDLTALTRALFHPADRIAWLALLRAPWCGLTLADLQALAGNDHRAAVWRLMQDRCGDGHLQTLSADGARRLTRVRTILDDFVASRRRVPAARWIEGAWLALGGPACVTERADLDDAQAYFRLLETLEQSGDILDFSALEAQVAKLFAAADAQADARLQLMTIHKAKGLEFDVVIVPGLGYTPRRNQAQLLAWQERPRAHGDAELLLGTLREASEDSDPIYTYLDALEKRKAANEDARLLYVAATRAKSRLHLVGQIDAAAEKPGPRAGSLLSRLWPAVAGDFQGVSAPVADDSASEAAVAAPHLIHRLPLEWTPPPPPVSVALALPAADIAHGSAHDQVEFSWASETAKHIGTVVHRLLQRVAEDGLERWDEARVRGLSAVYQRDLKRLGVPDSEMRHAVERVTTALSASLNDPRGRWVLGANDGKHQQARAEMRLTGVIDEATVEVVDVVIDRTFIDEHGARWIVDFKTSVHEGADRDAFLDNERVRYAAQLQRYGALMRLSSEQVIRLGLYFPLLGGWREWRYDG